MLRITQQSANFKHDLHPSSGSRPGRRPAMASTPTDQDRKSWQNLTLLSIPDEWDGCSEGSWMLDAARMCIQTSPTDFYKIVIGLIGSFVAQGKPCKTSIYVNPHRRRHRVAGGIVDAGKAVREELKDRQLLVPIGLQDLSASMTTTATLNLPCITLNSFKGTLSNSPRYALYDPISP